MQKLVSNISLTNLFVKCLIFDKIVLGHLFFGLNFHYLAQCKTISVL